MVDKLARGECQVLELLMDPAVKSRGLTFDEVAERAGIARLDALRMLEVLRDRQPPLARDDIDAGRDERVWKTTSHTADAFQDGCSDH